MPHIQFINTDKDIVKAISIDLVNELARCFECPNDHISFEILKVKAYAEGHKVSGDIRVYIEMFDRGSEVRQNVVNIITDYLSVKNDGDIAVIFKIIEPHMYYENKKHF